MNQGCGSPDGKPSAGRETATYVHIVSRPGDGPTVSPRLVLSPCEGPVGAKPFGNDQAERTVPSRRGPTSGALLPNAPTNKLSPQSSAALLLRRALHFYSAVSMLALDFDFRSAVARLERMLCEYLSRRSKRSTMEVK